MVQPSRLSCKSKVLAASMALPLDEMIAWTQAELAVLTVIGEVAYEHGVCDLLNGDIAERAGVSRSLVQRTLSDAAETGLISIERLRGSILRPNRVTIGSKWRNWLASTYDERGKMKKSTLVGECVLNATS